MKNTRKTWVSSDHHFRHRNILKFSPETRPFVDIDHMQETIIAKHNKVVAPNDHVYFVGDFCFGKPAITNEILQEMNGIKFFIKGNHDHTIALTDIPNENFQWVKDYYQLKGFHSAPIILFHYPIYAWNRMHFGALHFYGHTHGDLPTIHSGRGKDIGLDTNDCYPYNVRKLVAEMDQCEIYDARSRPTVR